MKHCPYCAEEIQDAAKICRFCHRDLATGQTTLQNVAVVAPQPSRGVAAVLSLVIPGAGQMYKGQLGKGFAFLFFTALGYLMFIAPGIILHIIAIGDAAQEQRAKPAEIELPPLTPEERRKKDLQFLRGAAIVVGIIVLGIVVSILIPDRPRVSRAPAPSRQSSTTSVGDTVYLDAKDWATKLKGVADRAGESCARVIATFENGQRSGGHVWSMRCVNGNMYAVTFRKGHPATIAPCEISARSGIPCFEKLAQ